MPEGDITLRDYMDTRFADIDRALSLATATLEKRLEGMNEFRTQLKEQAGQFITRTELGVTVSRFNEDIESLKLTRAEMQGKANQSSVVVSFFLSVGGMILGAAGIVINWLR